LEGRREGVRDHLIAPVAKLDAAVLDALDIEEDIVETAVTMAMEALSASADDAAAQAIERELATLRDECARLTAAIATGGALDALVSALRDREGRRVNWNVRSRLSEPSRRDVSIGSRSSVGSAPSSGAGAGCCGARSPKDAMCSAGCS
jgi:hypothetical protein